jgi:hypothetical protein
MPPRLASASPGGARLDPSSVIEAVLGSPERLEGALEVAFGAMLGNPSRLAVELGRGTPAERLRGYFRRIRVSFENGALDQLKVSRAVLEATEVHYDLHALLAGEAPLPRRVGETRLAVQIEQEAMNAILDAKRASLGVRNPKVKLLDGALQFSGGIRLLFLNSQIQVRGALDVRNGHQVHFRPHRLEVSRIRLPGAVVRGIARRFNPVVDLARAPWWATFRPRLDVVEVRPGLMQVRSADFPDPPESRSPGRSVADSGVTTVVPFGSF